MRHQQKLPEDSYAIVDIAAVWPAGVQVAPLPIPEIDARETEQAFTPTPAAPEMPAGVGKLIVGSYVTLLAAFALATVASAYSMFMIAISALFLVAFFTVPWIVLRQEPVTGKRPEFGRFMEDGIETLTGHSSGSAALVQMLIVPVFLTLGVIGMGIAVAIIM